VTSDGGRAGVAQMLQETRDADAAVYRALAGVPMPGLDRPMRQLSQLADRSVLWFGIAGVMALFPGRPRRAAVSGAAAIGIASATVNLGAKHLLRRPRPDPVAAVLPPDRRGRMPLSSSFPSGHAATAFAFATSVSSELPWFSLPMFGLATAVAYSRVHTGAHYPVDVVAGAAVGATSASAAARLTRRLMPTL
jgi:membrane-associated phospholipid phosphatase